MPEETFYSQPNCDRCPNDLKTRTQSWFNKDVICMDCKDKENELKQQLKETGVDPSALEGCGYIPEPKPINPEEVLTK